MNNIKEHMKPKITKRRKNQWLTKDSKDNKQKQKKKHNENKTKQSKQKQNIRNNLKQADHVEARSFVWW